MLLKGRVIHHEKARHVASPRTIKIQHFSEIDPAETPRNQGPQHPQLQRTSKSQLQRESPWFLVQALFLPLRVLSLLICFSLVRVYSSR